MGLPREDNPAPSGAAEVCRVWFATEARVKNPFKLWLMDDHGELAVLPGRLRFKGRKTSLDCLEVLEVGLVRQAVPWLNLLIGALCILALVYASVKTRFEHPGTIPILVFVAVLTVLTNGPSRWVRVEYADESGEPRRAYFSDGSASGWGRLFGGTTRLYHKLRAAVTASQSGG